MNSINNLWSALGKARAAVTRVRPPRRVRATTGQEKLDARTMSCKVRPGVKEKFFTLADDLDISPSALQANLIEAFIASQQDVSQCSLPDDALTHLQEAARAYIEAKQPTSPGGEGVTPLEGHWINRHIHRFQANGIYNHGDAA